MLGSKSENAFPYFSPKNQNFGGVIGNSNQICKKFKSSYLQNYTSDYHKIWQADVDQWKDFVGGPMWWRNKSKMADEFLSKQL